MSGFIKCNTDLRKSNVCFIMIKKENNLKNGKEQESTKTRILETSIKLFAKKGYDAVSVREICSMANVNLCMISYYFGGKKDLYNAIIDDLIDKQTHYAETFLDFSILPESLSKEAQVDLLFMILDKFIDFFYTKISSDLILLLLKEQQNPNFCFKSPSFQYLRRVVAAVFNLPFDSKKNIYQTLFIISQINAPKIFPAFSFRLLGQDTFYDDDIKIIRNNIKFYINLILKEKGIV